MGSSHASSGSGALYSSSGVSAQTLMQLQAQGELQRTDQPLDLALDGDGLLLVRDKSGTLGGARTGAFHLTKEGRIQDAKGLTLQGWPLLPGGAGFAAPTTGSAGTSTGVSTPGETGGTQSSSASAENPTGSGSAGTDTTGPGSTSMGVGTTGAGTAGSGANAANTAGSGSVFNTSTRGAAVQYAPPPSAAFLGPLGALEDIQLIKPDPTPPQEVPAPPPQLAPPAEEVAPPEEPAPPPEELAPPEEEPIPSNTYGTGTSIQQEAHGLCSVHSSASCSEGDLIGMHTERTLTDSLGKEHKMHIYARHGYGNTEYVSLYHVDTSANPRINVVFQRSAGILSVENDSNGDISYAVDKAAEQLVMTLNNTGAQLTLDISDFKTTLREIPVLGSGETVLWNFPPIIFEEGTITAITLMRIKVSSFFFYPKLNVDRNADGSFAAQLKDGNGYSNVTLYSDEEGRVSGYMFTKNAYSTSDPSVGIKRAGCLVEGLTSNRG
ncbi:MAG: hypothetical protein LBJ70_02240, partial [Holosporales bacterium]|nr:hypothetical protein [Holosporales bacterium]